MKRIFVIINRINSILLLLVLGLASAAVSIVWISRASSQWQHRGAIKVTKGDAASKSPVFLRLERIENIAGTNAQMMLLSAEKKSGQFSSGSGYGSETRNVLFLTGNEKSARWLFPNQNNVVLVTAQLREVPNDSKDKPTRALYFEYITKDTSGDGKLTFEDHSTVALSKPDGSALVEVLHEVNRVLSYKMLDDQHLSVVYQVENTVRHARFSVLSLVKESDQEIVNVPDQL